MPTECHVGCVTVNRGTLTAKDLLLMAPTADDQKKWVQMLSKKITAKPAIEGGNRPDTLRLVTLIHIVSIHLVHLFVY